jgi:hypothetical protein
MDHASAVQRIAQLTGIEFGPANGEGLAVLTQLGAPESLLRFYRNFEPQREAEVGKVRMLPVSDVVVENNDAVPGVDLRPHGFVTFATTIYGDVYCFDTSANTSKADAPVVIMTHEVIFEGLQREGRHVCSEDCSHGFRRLADSVHCWQPGH